MRFIRTYSSDVTAPVKSAEVDGIADPQLLAHALFNMTTKREQFPYSSFLRCSSLHDVCVREKILGLRSGVMWGRATPAGLQMTFDIGNAVHRYLQDSGDYLSTNFLGWWQCLNCGFMYFGRRPSQECSGCGSSVRCINYSEYSLKMETPYRVTGHIDGFVEVAPGDLRILDFKTCSGKDFEAMTAPKGDHTIQVNAYMMLMQADTQIPVQFNPDKGFVAYISKRHQKGIPVKVFPVRKDPDVVGYLQDTLESFNRGVVDPTYVPDPLPECRDGAFATYRGRNCPMKEQCQKNFEKTS